MNARAWQRLTPASTQRHGASACASWLRLLPLLTMALLAPVPDVAAQTQPRLVVFEGFYNPG